MPTYCVSDYYNAPNTLKAAVAGQQRNRIREVLSIIKPAEKQPPSPEGLKYKTPTWRIYIYMNIGSCGKYRYPTGHTDLLA